VLGPPKLKKVGICSGCTDPPGRSAAASNWAQIISELEKEDVAAGTTWKGPGTPTVFAGAMGELLCAIAEQRQPFIRPTQLLSLQLTFAACRSSDQDGAFIAIDETSESPGQVIGGSMPSYVIGVDGGTTKTIAFVADLCGQILGVARGSGSNATGENVDEAMGVVVQTTREALQKSG